jgi:hypothetical protein
MTRVARFSLAQHTKLVKKYQISTRYTKWPQNKTYGRRKIDQIATKYSNIGHYKTLENFLNFFGLEINHLATLVMTEKKCVKLI